MSSLNVGVLGHVDCGKTTLTKRLAEMASTSAFDKHVEAGGRRNTLDLGFSSLIVSGRRLALVDCPGHAGLIRAVLAASTVFDMAIVVIDAGGGVQAQTAEHLLLCSIFCPSKVIIVINKIDLVDPEKILETKKKVKKALGTVGVSGDSPMVEMSLVDGSFSTAMLDNLRRAIKDAMFEPTRAVRESFLMAVDHCFSIKGKGTVLTGTVLQGTLRLGQEFEIPHQNEKRKAKTLESWKESVKEVEAGERAAMLVANFDEAAFSRTIVGAPGTLRGVRRCLASVHPVSFFRSTLASGTKMHVSIGFETVMATCQFLRPFDDEYEQLHQMEIPCVVMLSFEKTVFTSESGASFLMASRLDQQGKGCRFAFHGNIVQTLQSDVALKRFSRKYKKGSVERIEENGRSAICTGMFKRETKIELFVNMMVRTVEGGVIGRIEGSFGKSGKIRVRFETEVEEKNTVELHLKKYLNDNSIVSYVPL